MLKNDLKLPFPFIKDGQQNDKKKKIFKVTLMLFSISTCIFVAAIEVLP